MTISYRIDTEKNIVFTEGSGTLTDDDFLNFRQRLVDDPAFRPGMRELADFRSVERHEHTTEGLNRFLEQDRKFIDRLGKDYRIAIVTNSDLHYGFSRIYMASLADALSNIQVFRDFDEAQSWLFGNDHDDAKAE